MWIQKLQTTLKSLKFDDRLEWNKFVYRLSEKIKIHFKLPKSIFIPHKWEIYYVELWKNISTELNKKRPCVVWSEKKYNTGGNLVILPLKTYNNKFNQKYNVIIVPTRFNWLIKESIITITDIRSVSKKRFWGKLWIIGEFDKQIIDQKLKNILWIKKP